ncbi:murein biosynthesis integral membrane protein MurJ [Brachybacterium sp. YJGR34]|uniref:murein biosynthesis integral membrane protein MurJ n=1 Tax=Brachybacterium sp. YJGR34 TaxID=2059911 RepID=UPI000E0A2B46|nr:lipid II flippase MurJ [Brachybacterium sp. YJGR34]
MSSARRRSSSPTARATILRSVLRGAGVILIVTVLARIAGFVRYLVFGASVGAGDVGTAYTTANMLPNVLFEVVAGGALAAVVVPLIAGLVPERDPDDHLAGTGEEGSGGPAGAARADRIISALLGWTILLTLVLALAVILLADPLAQLLLAAEGPDTGGAALGASLLRIFAVQLPLYGISVVLAAYLQARKRFLWPAMMPLISSVVVMVSYRVYAHLVPPVATTTTIDETAVAWLGWGTTVGVAAMAVPVVVAALRAGLHLRPTLVMPPGYGRRAVALGGAGLGAVGAQQVVLALVMLLAMRAGGVGTLPVFQYAQALYLLPYAVLVVPLVTAVFPHLSELRLVGDGVGFARVSAVSVRTVMVIATIGGAMLFAGGPALEQFFRLIDRSGAAGVGSTAAALALGLPGFAVAIQCTRILSAALRARDALLVGSVGWAIAGVLIIALIAFSPERSAAEASTLFGLCIAAGMALSGLVGLSRTADILKSSGAMHQVTRTAAGVPAGLLLGGVPGLLLGKWMVTTGTGEVGAALSGILCGLLGAVLAGAVMVLADRELGHQVLARLRRRDDAGPAETAEAEAER